MFLQTSVCLNCFYVYPQLLINTIFFFFYIYMKSFSSVLGRQFAPGLCAQRELPLTKSVKDDLL